MRRRRGPIDWCNGALWLLAAAVPTLSCAELLGVDSFRDQDGTTSTTSAAGGGPEGGAGGHGHAGHGGPGGHTGGAAGSTPSDCWGSSNQGWSVTTFDRAELNGDTPLEPMLAADGRTLYYMAGPTGAKRPHLATRSDVATAFSGGTPLPVDWSTEPAAGEPWVVGDELFLMLDGATRGFGPAVSVNDGTHWQQPTSLGPQLDTTYAETGITLSADGTRLMFARNDGPDAFWGPTAELYEASRAAPVAPGDSFGTPALTQLPGIGDEHYVMCPVLSPDGTRLFFATSFPDVVDDQNYLHALNVWYAQRDDVSGAWQAPLHVAELDSFVANACPSAVSADGCELWSVRFVLGQAANEFVIARRTP